MTGVNENTPVASDTVRRMSLPSTALNSTFTSFAPFFCPLTAMKPVIPKPLNSKFTSFPRLHKSVLPSKLISNCSFSKLQPAGGAIFNTYSPLSYSGKK